MTLGVRKFIVLLLLAAVFLLANVWLVVNWLDQKGVIGFAEYIRMEYVTGTAITIIVVLLILLVKPGRRAAAGLGLVRRCPVCDHVLLGRGKYCGECGSRVCSERT